MRYTSAPVSRLAVAGITMVLAVTGGSTAAQPPAQTATPRTWLRVDRVQVKPELWAEYRDIERDEVIPALRKAGVRFRAVWRTAEFGSTYELIMVRPIPDFAEYDVGDSLSKALAPREAERLRTRLRRCLLSRDSSALLQRSDLGVGETGRPFIIVTTFSVAPGRGTEFEGFLRETLPQVKKKTDIVFGVYQRVYGLPAAWLIVQNLDSLRQLSEPGGLLQTFGEQGADRLVTRLSDIVTAVERRVLRFDPELSFSAQSAGSSPD
jgi:hypothetical protein